MNEMCLIATSVGVEPCVHGATDKRALSCFFFLVAMAVCLAELDHGSPLSKALMVVRWAC